MNRSVRTQATAFSLAAVITLTLLASINQLATAPAPDALLARMQGDTAAQQVVLVTGNRIAG